MTDPYKKYKYVCLWDNSSRDPSQSVMEQTNSLSNSLGGMVLWEVEAKQAVWLNDQKGASPSRGLVSDPNLAICGYLVVHGDMDGAQDIASKLDRDVLSSPGISAASQEALATTYFLSITGSAIADRSVILMWAPLKSLQSVVPPSLMVESLHAFNGWRRSIQVSGYLIDSGRFYVTRQAVHYDKSGRQPGRQTSGNLLAVGRFLDEGQDIDTALASSGLDLSRFRLEIADGSNWWSSGNGVAERYDDPKNMIFV